MHMKNIFFSLVTLIMVSSVMSANGFDKPKSSTTGMAIMKTGSTFKLFYKGAKAGNVRVTIYDNEGNAVFEETIHKMESFVRPYNFSSLVEGEYTIALTDEEGKLVEKVNYVNVKTKRLMNLVKVTGTKSKYMLSISNKGADALTVRIYDGGHNLVYQETERVSGDFAKVYDLKNLDKGFSFDVTDKNGVSKSFTY
jgi:hypothetical protein